MIIKPNWDKFKAKYNDNPTYYFEYFCYLLFCIEYNKPQGIFRYKNQSGVEWNPIEVDGKNIVAQCKFYDTTLGDYKIEILKMLETIQKNYSTPCELKFYTNQDWGQGKKEDTNDSKPKIEIENKAKQYGITIDWRTNEAYFLSPDVVFNKEIAKHFFTDESIYDLIYEKQQHSERILQNIHTEITFDSQTIELDRTQNIQELENKILENQVLILTGVGGVGKTAIIKKLYEQEREKDKIPFYIFKASEFNLPLIDYLFGKYSLQRFIDIHDKYEEKIMVIDSSEKLLDIDNLDPFNQFLTALINNKWRIIFTTRDNYLEDLQYRFIDFGIKVPAIYIKNLTQKELSTLSTDYNFLLSRDTKLNTLIGSPLYLNEYLRFYKKDEGLNYQEFKEKLWNNKINNSNSTREKCFFELAFKRANKGNFYINIDCPSNSLDTLVQDGILGKESAGYFITHDIYEEWALEKIIENRFINRDSNLKFFKNIGSSLPIRRSFRNWVSEKLLLDSDDMQSFIEEIIDDKKIKLFWKDEVFVSILFSDYSDTFFENFERELLVNDYELLIRISFLLRVACKEADNSVFEQYNLDIDNLTMFSMMNQPKGNGWKSFIAFVYKHIDTIKLQNINKILPILYDWNFQNKKGKTTQKASLTALKYYEWINQEDYYRDDEHIDEICKIIINGSFEIKSELEVIFSKIIKNKWKNHNDNYYKLSIMILTQINGWGITKDLSIDVLKLANFFWTKIPKEIDNSGIFSHYEREEVEDAFNLENEYEFNYFPSSAYQTPIYRLLENDFKNTVDFILEFVNNSVKKYAQSGWERKFQGRDVEEVKLYIENKTYTQYHSQSLWNIYRGTSSPISPNLLQSIHMALEKYLLEIAKNLDLNSLEGCLIYLLKNSKSSSISAIIASVVLANENKTFNIATILFKTKEFIQSDLTRQMKDSYEVKSLNSIGYGLNFWYKFHQDERLKTCEENHRQCHLESLFLNYQLFRTGEVSEEASEKRQKTLWEILDNFYNRLSPEKEQSENEKTWRMFLARMDKRKMNIETTRVDKGIQLTFNPELSPELKEHSESSQQESTNGLKYTKLYLWSINRIENNQDYKKYKEFEENPLLALQQLQEIVEVPYEEKEFILSDETLPNVSIILLKDYSSQLSNEDKEFCKDIILEFATLPFSENYRYQISDGAKSAISFLPILLKKTSELEENIRIILLFNLFTDYEIGMSGENFYDYSINAIKGYFNEEEVENFILGYLFLSPKYHSLYIKLHRENYRIKESEVREKFLEDYEQDIERFINRNITLIDIDNISDIKLDFLKVAFKMIPSNFSSKTHKELIQNIIEVFIPILFSQNRRDNDIKYMTKQIFIDKITNLTLQSKHTDITIYLQPLLDSFEGSEDVSKLFTQFILTQDKLEKYDNFWYIWELFEDKIIELCKNRKGYYSKQIINAYLLAWGSYGDIWKKSAKDWHSLKEKDKRFFKRMSEKIGHCPSTLYSISKLLTSVGSSYLNDGIGWISSMIKNNPNLLADKLETNTIFNIQILARQYILQNSEKIKKEKVKKQEILEILNFLVEKGSAIGYMLRERIL